MREGVVTAFAGKTSSIGSVNGVGTVATFYVPYGLSVNPLTGVLFVADTYNDMIRTISSSGARHMACSSDFKEWIELLLCVVIQRWWLLWLALAWRDGWMISALLLYSATHLECEFPIWELCTLQTLLTTEFELFLRQVISNLTLRAFPQCNLFQNCYFVGVVSTLAGSGSSAVVNGVGTSASIGNPCGIASDSIGNIFVTSSSYRMRMITSSG